MEKNKKRGRTKPEIYSRVVGYLRPVQQWNIGKQAEFGNRKMFKLGKQIEVANPKIVKIGKAE